MSTQTLTSKAVFKAKLKKLDLLGSLNDFVRLGWDTLGKFAFAGNYTPGKPDDTPFVNEVVIPLFGKDNPPEKAALRQLYYIAYAMNAAVTAREVNQVEDEEKPKKLPAPERSARFDELKDKLAPGLKLEGELEPSFFLVDKMVAMRDSGEVRYLKWDELTKREQEIRGVKKDEYFGENKDGLLQKFFKSPDLRADIKDLLRLQYALQRRGLAFELARLMSFEQHERLVKFLFAELTRDPMEDHHPVSLQQVKEADLQFWLRIAELTRAGFDGTSEDELPLDEYVSQIIAEPRIAQLLFQKQKAGNKGDIHNDVGNKRDHDADNERLKRENKRLKADNQKKGKGKGQGHYGGQGNYGNQGNYQGGKGSKAGKQGGKNNNKDRSGPMPRELVGMNRTVRGKSVCFDYNMRKGCPVKGERCTLGEHLCAFPGCEERHSLQDCRAYKKSRESGNY